MLCMIREWGSPILFLTLTCAEYDSPEINRYLHEVNNVPENYPIVQKMLFQVHGSVINNLKISFQL